MFEQKPTLRSNKSRVAKTSQKEACGPPNSLEKQEAEGSKTATTLKMSRPEAPKSGLHMTFTFFFHRSTWLERIPGSPQKASKRVSKADRNLFENRERSPCLAKGPKANKKIIFLLATSRQRPTRRPFWEPWEFSFSAYLEPTHALRARSSSAWPTKLRASRAHVASPGISGNHETSVTHLQ